MNTKTIAIIFLVIAGAIAIHQYTIIQSFFEIKDIHHEMFIFGFALTGTTLLILGETK